IQSEAEQIVPALAKNLEGADPDVVFSSAIGLTRFGRKAEAAEPQLLSAIERAAAVGDLDPLHALIRALRAATSDAKSSLRSYFAVRDPEIRRLAIGINGDMEK